MANMQESSPVFFSQRRKGAKAQRAQRRKERKGAKAQRRKGAKAQRAQSILCVFIYKKEHFVFSLRPWRLCESK